MFAWGGSCRCIGSVASANGFLKSPGKPSANEDNSFPRLHPTSEYYEIQFYWYHYNHLFTIKYVLLWWNEMVFPRDFISSSSATQWHREAQRMTKRFQIQLEVSHEQLQNHFQMKWVVGRMIHSSEGNHNIIFLLRALNSEGTPDFEWHHWNGWTTKETY